MNAGCRLIRRFHLNRVLIFLMMSIKIDVSSGSENMFKDRKQKNLRKQENDGSVMTRPWMPGVVD